MIDFDIKTAPIQFAKQADGAYLSTSGQFKIHKTVHTGYGSGDAPTRRWITDLTRGRGFHRLSHRHWPRVNDYTTSLKTAIECLHHMIARDICAAFQVFTDWRHEVECAERETAAHQASINNARLVIETNIIAWLTQHGAEALTQTNGVRSLALYLATPGGAL